MYFNIKMKNGFVPKIHLSISSYQETEKLSNGANLIKAFACYTHPEFKRANMDWGEYDWVCVLDGEIVGPDFDKLQSVIQLKETFRLWFHGGNHEICRDQGRRVVY